MSRTVSTTRTSILVGVSRTSKTPLSIYLGYLGHKAANVPVVKGIAPPAELFEVDQAKVVGLTIDPNRLVEIRRARVRAMGAPGRNRQYAELAEIYEELEQAKKLHRRLALPGDRHLRAVDRGDRAPHPPRRRGARRRDEGAGRAVTAKPRIPLWRWGLWWLALLVGDIIFYVLLTPIWIGLRALAWMAEFRAQAPLTGKPACM